MTSLFTEGDLIAARDAGLLSDDAHRALVAYLRNRVSDAAMDQEAPSTRPAPVRFDLTHVLWYAGALVVILAMGVFTTEAFNRMGGMALTATGVAYAAGFLGLGHYLWHGRGLTTPGGLAVAVAVAMVPMAIYGIQDRLGLWAEPPGEYRDFFPFINASWVHMELGTVAAAILVLLAYPFPFITMIAAVALWFLPMDLAGWFAPDHVAGLALRRDVSLGFGLAVILVAWMIDLKWRSRGNFAFWLHLAGAAAFWGGLTFYQNSSEWLAFLYCLVNIGLGLFSVFIDRRVYAVFGALGIANYLGHLAYDVFPDTLLFSFALSAIGLLIIGLGVFYHKKQEAIARWLDVRLPDALRALRPLGSPD